MRSRMDPSAPSVAMDLGQFNNQLNCFMYYQPAPQTWCVAYRHLSPDKITQQTPSSWKCGFLYQHLSLSKKSTLTGTKQPPDDQDQQALSDSPRFYSKEINYACWYWNMKTHPGKASIGEFLFPLSNSHGRSTPQHSPLSRRPINHAQISKTLWPQRGNVLNSTTQTVY